MSKTITLRLDEDVYRAIRTSAERDNRPLSNFIETATMRFIHENEIVDQYEMAEIRKNSDLNSSLKRGLKDAKSGGAPLSDYRVFETEEFKKQNKRLELRRGRSFEKKLNEYVYPQLRQEPHYGPNIKCLQGYEPQTWRYRIGDFRLFYSIDEKEKIVFILTIDDRKDVYK